MTNHQNHSTELPNGGDNFFDMRRQRITPDSNHCWLNTEFLRDGQRCFLSAAELRGDDGRWLCISQRVGE